MRLLFVTTPGAGHLQPLLGLALAARARGHEVAWATAPDAFALLHAHGLETFAAGLPFGAAIGEFRRRWPEIAAVAPRAQGAASFPRLFGRCVAEAMLPALRRSVAEWAPDLIVNEPAALAAPLAAATHGVRHLTHAFGLPLPEALLRDSAEALAPAWRAAGLDPPAHAGLFRHGAIEIVPPMLFAASGEPQRAPRVLVRRPGAIAGPPGATLPESLAAFLGTHDAQRPLLYASFGTLHWGGPLLGALMAALGSLAVRAVLTTGPLVALPPGRTPPANVWVGAYVPQDLVLPHCAAVISHGGSGTAWAALAAGLPQLCLPQGADQFRNADALAACGAALVLETAPGGAGPAPPVLAEAIARLLGDAPLRRAARALQAEIDTLPGADAAVAALERW